MLFEIKLSIEAESIESALKKISGEYFDKNKKTLSTNEFSSVVPVKENTITANVPEVSNIIPTMTVLPTAEARCYTTDEIAKAMVQLRDLKGVEEVKAILSQFGVNALTAIPVEKYNELVTILNTKGVKV